MTQSVAQRYLRLGLQLGRHVEGIVDAYCGPPEPAAAVEAAPPVNPRTLVAAAEALLDELEDGWLHDQVVGLRTYAGVLAGESASYADEVEGMLRRAADLHRGSPLHSRARAARGAAPRRRAGDRARQALAGVLRLPRRPAQPDRRQRRSADVGHRAAPAHDPRDVSRPPRGALQQGAPARARPRAARGDAGARAHAAVARLGGGRRARAVRAARRRSEQGRGARVSRALGSDDPEARGPNDPLPHRADLADLRDHLPCRTRALPLVRGGRPGALPSPADRAGARPRPARGSRVTRHIDSSQVQSLVSVQRPRLSGARSVRHGPRSRRGRASVEVEPARDRNELAHVGYLLDGRHRPGPLTVRWRPRADQLWIRIRQPQGGGIV